MHAGGGVPLLPEHVPKMPVAPHDCVPQSLQLRVTLVVPAHEPHEPSAAHVSVPHSPQFLVAPGLQLPHPPLMHTVVHAAPLDCQLPFASQVWGCIPAH